MKYILACWLALASAALAQSIPFPGPGMTAASVPVPTFIVESHAGGISNATTPAVSTAGANFIVVAITDVGTTINQTLSDSKSNTWTPLTSKTTAGFATGLFYSTNPTVGSGHTFTATGGGNTFPGIVMFAFSNVATTSPFDVQNGGTSASSTVQPGSITPSANGYLIVTALGVGVNTTPTINSGFSTPLGIPLNAGVNEGVWMSYLVQNPAAAINPTWTVSGASALIAVVGDFKHI